MDQQTPVFEDEDPTPPPAPPPTEDDAFWGTAAEATPAGATPHRPLRTWLAAGIGTAVIAAAAFAGVNLARSESTTLARAAGPAGGGFGPGGFGGPGRGTNGTIASIDGPTFTVTTPAGTTVKVVTNSSTTFTVTSAGSLANIRPGDNVTVMGTTSGTSVAAERITDSGSRAAADGFDGPPPAGAQAGPPAGAQGAPPAAAAGQGPRDGRGGPPNAGVVKAVTGTSFTMTTAAGATLTVTTSSATTVTVVTPGSLGALKVGDQVNVNGTTSDSTVTATSVRAGEVGFGPADGRAAR